MINSNGVAIIIQWKLQEIFNGNELSHLTGFYNERLLIRKDNDSLSF